MDRHLSTAFCLLLTAGLGRAQSVLVEQHGPLPGDRMGFAVAGGFDLDLDGLDDVVVGNPYDDVGGLTDNGSVLALSGRDGSILHMGSGDDDFDHMGWSVALVPDMDGDGRPELLAGAPNARSGNIRPGMARLVSTGTWTVLRDLVAGTGGSEFGYSVTGGFDADSDGVPDLAIGAPGGQSGSASVRFFTQVGQFRHLSIISAAAGFGETLATLAPNHLALSTLGDTNTAGSVAVLDTVTLDWVNLYGQAPNDRFGASLAVVPDLDSDGYDELLIGAPRASEALPDAGRVALFNVQAELELGSWDGDAAGDRLGASLAYLGDVLGGPKPEFAAGALEPGVGDGSVRVFSLNSPSERYRVTGEPASQFGSSLARAGDVNGDGFVDFVAGGPSADDPLNPANQNVGLLRIHSGGGPGIVSYCQPGTSAAGCQALLTAGGTPSATFPNGFFLAASDVQAAKVGQFFYGANGRQASPWGNGTSLQCVAPPVKRGGLLVPAGTIGTCDGFFLQDLNARWCATCPKPSHNFGVGAVVQAQLWYRDPDSTSNQTTSLSNAVEFVIQP